MDHSQEKGGRNQETGESPLTLQTLYVTLASEDLPELVAFYQGLLGYSPHSHLPERYAEFWLPGLKLALFKPSADHRQEFSNPAGSMSLCLEVANLQVAIATLTDLGYPPPGSITHASHGQEIYAYDPRGNRLILHQSNASNPPNPSD
ncbi:VOC family protein [Leptothoe sp. PORK10 BA2]|uniref:VOC family protein n=1 Tax=Leptothoe sp. PORK10 BA2 TaxID=3110254 RepID=UPI002B20526B|nr:VOC family protein [Leptothoe sp. PORK10 BA2]MEA5463076.1 VOC family protein [Leptothoe sp. PORK10 BA2]